MYKIASQFLPVTITQSRFNKKLYGNWRRKVGLREVQKILKVKYSKRQKSEEEISSLIASVSVYASS